MARAEDYSEIMNAFACYSQAIDRHDWPQLEGAFDDESTWITALGVPIRGLSNITITLQALKQSGPPQCVHVPFNVHVSFGEGDAVADSTSNWLYIGRTKRDDPWEILSTGAYEDKLKRVADGWRFVTREIHNFDFVDPKTWSSYSS